MKTIDLQRNPKPVALAVVLLGLAVRVYNLTYHSLWFDEAVSVNWARQGVPRIVEVSMNLVEDRLPPLYYLLLHFWVHLAGYGEFALRFLSAIFGVLLVALVYRLGRELFGRWVGLVGAALAALNPFLVWYAQEVRMYAPAAFLTAAATFCLVKALRDEGRGAAYWAGYVLCAAAGLYTHLFSGFLLPAHALFFLLYRRRYGQKWRRFGLALLAVTLLFAPLAWANWRASSEAGPGDPLADLGGRLWWLLNDFTAYKAQLSPTIVALLGALALAAFLPLRHPLRHADEGRREGAVCLALCLFVPVAVADLLLLRSRLMFYGSRYFIVVIPFLALAMAAGVERMGRLHPAAGASALLLALGALAFSLPANWRPESRKEEWRATVDYLAIHARPGQAILVHPDFVRLPYQYYERGPGRVYALFSGPLSDEAQVEQTLEKIAKRHQAVWLVQSHTETPDPQRVVERWLAARYPLITEQYPPGVTIKGYATGYRLSRLPEEARPVGARLAGVRLAGYELYAGQFRATDDLYHPPSGWIHLTLYWQSGDERPKEDYTAFVHLVDGGGQVWGAQLDRLTGAMRFYPPSRWQAGEVIRDDYDVNLNPATPPGTYRLVVGLTDDVALVPVVLGEVQIVR